MTEEERYIIFDLIPQDMVIWEDDEELPYRQGLDWMSWRASLGHPYSGHGFCRTCGCGTTCILLIFKDALIASVIRELDSHGVLRTPGTEEEHDQ